jgi:uncharacterized membrane protein YjjP (DUF1212 family)
MKAEASSVVVAFAGLVVGGIFLFCAMLDGAEMYALVALAMTLYCGGEFVARADFNVLS